MSNTILTELKHIPAPPAAVPKEQAKEMTTTILNKRIGIAQLDA